MSLNKVMLIGNVGQDPEIRYIDQNTKVATINIATTERYRDRNMETKESTTWHRIIAWRGLADLAEKYIKKGGQIYVEGKLQSRSYTDKSGVNRNIFEVVADTIQLLGRRSDSSNDFQGHKNDAGVQNSSPQYTKVQPDAYPSSNNQTVTPNIESAEADDDLPF